MPKLRALYASIDAVDVAGLPGPQLVEAWNAMDNGVTKEELQESFLHASVYCGFPAAVDAFRAAAEVVDDTAS